MPPCKSEMSLGKAALRKVKWIEGIPLLKPEQNRSQTFWPARGKVRQ